MRRRPASVLLWFPVAAIVGALFLLPSGSGAAARAGTLTVTPYTSYSDGHTTGGQLLHFSGDVGKGGVRLFMERRGNKTSPWVRVPDPRTGEDFSIVTRPDGSFDFDFPAPAMNNPWFQLAGGGVDTEDYQFHSVFPDVEVTGPTSATVGSLLVLGGDTRLRPQDDRPIIQGRGAALQVRDDTGEWETVRTGTVDAGGQITFSGILVTTPGTLTYRIRLDDWQQGGDDIGWHQSHPFTVMVEVLR